MNKVPWRNMGYGLLFALYPLLVYLGLRYFDPRWLALLLIVAASSRLVRAGFSRRIQVLAGVAVIAAAGYTLLTGSELGILLYPVLVNAVLLSLFGASLLQPPTIVETLARIKEPDLPEAAISYTRKVTQLWCLFFLFNGFIAMVTVALVTQGFGREWWLLYNGFLAYVLMGTLLAGELLVRKRVRSRISGIERNHERA
ncbi:hypothetical protein Q6D67_05330 [Haliea sp. E1-2-M8]|uniref:COG4648 family protein n=1 Tax=Haliea sp. E1-2-M8 TaxID=3064706 RepID=UPI002726B528|nr:hypothetical protein [Haliea sp. E1-2-M8]MDO8861119.1 hypothetical protein [Haliea sp. E1-2-M8]